MKTKFLTTGLLMFILTSFLACNQEKKEATIDKEQIKIEIQAIEDNLELVFNTRNIDTLSYYADDAVSYFAGQDPIIGIDAIHQHIEDELWDFPEGATISFETLEIYITDDGSHVAEIGAHTLVDSTGMILQTGHYFSFFAKRDGRWVCTRDMANSVQMAYDPVEE